MIAGVFDPEMLAFETVLKLVEATGTKEEFDAFTRRGKELPQLIAQTGLLQALAFYMSKASIQSYQLIYRYLRGFEAAEKVSNVLKEDGKGEGSGYTTLLATAAIALSKMAEAKIINVDTCTNVDTLQKLASCLKQLREVGEDVVAERHIISYLVVVKRLLEAFYKRLGWVMP